MFNIHFQGTEWAAPWFSQKTLFGKQIRTMESRAIFLTNTCILLYSDVTYFKIYEHESA